MSLSGLGIETDDITDWMQDHVFDASNPLAERSTRMVMWITLTMMVVSSVERLISPAPIHYQEAIVVAVLGLLVNLVCAWILGRVHHAHSNGHTHGHALGHSHAHSQGHSHSHSSGHGDLPLNVQPTATGKSGLLHHSLQPPDSRALPCRPAISMARMLGIAVTPLPQ